MAIFTAMYFDLDNRAAESVVFAGIDILTIAYKEASERGGNRLGVLIDERIKGFPD